MSEKWEDKWRRVCEKLGGFTRADVRITLHEAMKAFASEWSYLDSIFGALKIPQSRPTFAFQQFAYAVNRDLALESNETPTDGTATFAEFLESVARAIQSCLISDRMLQIDSPHDTATGLRKPYSVPMLLNSVSWMLFSCAQWLGEGVARAGEKRSMFNPADFGSGDYPWSQPS